MAVLSGATLKVVPNLDGGVDEAVRVLSEVFLSSK